MDKQVIKVNSSLVDVIKTGKKLATTRLGLKTKYHLGPVKFINAEVPGEEIDDGWVIWKIEAVFFCNLTQELAETESYATLRDFRKALMNIYGPIEDFATLTVIYWDR